MDEKIKIQTPWFLGVEEVLNNLQTSNTGINEIEAEQRLEIFGYNKFKNQKQLV